MKNVHSQFERIESRRFKTRETTPLLGDSNEYICVSSKFIY